MVVPGSRHTRQAPGGRRSLKTQQHAGIVAALPSVLPKQTGKTYGAAIQPGSVDMLGPVPPTSPGLKGLATARTRLATDPGPGHR